MSALGTTADWQTIVRTVCVREWREAASNKLLVGMTLLPPLVITEAEADQALGRLDAALLAVGAGA